MSKFDTAQSILKSGYFTKLPIVDNTVDSEIILWRTVLDLALCDLLKGREFFREEIGPPSNQDFMETSIPTSLSATTFMGSVTWEKLVKWFDKTNDDFVTVCELAGLPPDGVYMRMREVLDES